MGCEVVAVIRAALLVLALPAHAQDRVAWGETACRITPTPDKPHIAEITCHNRLTGGVTDNMGSVSVGDIQIGMIATMQPGRIPDRFEAYPPDGYVAVPPAIEVNEDAAGVILVMPFLGY